MIRDAVTCDKPLCLGLMLEPVADPTAAPGWDRHPTRAEDVLEFADLITVTGWTYGPEGHTCPACVLHQGAKPVLERGDCPYCGGTTVTLHGKDTCHWCEREMPTGDDDGDDW